MKNINFILFFIKISYSLLIINPNPDSLSGNYPFSIKKESGSNEAIVFMDDSINIFDISQASTGPLSQLDIPTPLPYPYIVPRCISREENGGIYYNGYFFTSCLKGANSNEFQIKVYEIIGTNLLNAIFQSNYYSFSSGSIRFFKNSVSELIGVAWLNNGEFHMVNIDMTFNINYKHYPVSHMARDTDCLFITKHSRIVCLFGIELSGKYDCSVNIFTYDDGGSFVSNFKTWYICTNHLSRKVRGDTDNNIDSDLFYYYYVDTDNDAFIVPMRLVNPITIEVGTVFKVMSGCDDNQHSFDMAEDKFLGYNVFVCVEYRFKKRIKIQLFKIEDNQIIFYENRDVYNPYEFKNGCDSEISMINFVVLKSTLNFGFLSYKCIVEGGMYTIFNQPTCIDYLPSMMPYNLFQNKPITLNFIGVIQNDNYSGAKVEIVSTNPGMEVVVQDNGIDIDFTSIDYYTGTLSFTFKVKNDYYESEPCTANILVNNCFRNCRTCSYPSDDFFGQLCEGCKFNTYEINNFPLGINDNCCKKDVDCPDYLYLNSGTNKYEICSTECLACDEQNNCLTCYNQRELNQYYPNEQNYIKVIKEQTIPANSWYYWENTEHKKCVNKDGVNFIYLDDDTLTYMDCYPSCEKCIVAGNEENHNCQRCYEGSLYFHKENIYSSNCYKKEQVPHNYFLDTSSYSPAETTQSRFWRVCSTLCFSCDGPGQDECTFCVTGAYPKCEEKTNTNYECYDSLPQQNYFFNPDKNCYEKCDPNCQTCDKGKEGDTNNCLTCAFGQIYLNRNCYTNCPQTHYELNHIECVSECPDYAPFKLTNIGLSNEYKQCYNCAELGKCVYLGKRNFPDIVGDCVECNSIAKTFIANEDYGILDDCYSLCVTCEQRGNVTKMNCKTCPSDNPCLVEVLGNCVKSSTVVDNYYQTTGIIGGVTSCVYKKCYTTCKSCYGDGDNNDHNCITCKNNYQMDPTPGKSRNCVIVCQFYWYLNVVTNEYECTDDEECPSGYPFLNKLTKQCVRNCFIAFGGAGQLQLIYSFENTCLFQCPGNTMRDDILHICHSLDDVQDVFTHVQNYISQSTKANNLLIYSSDRKKYFHLFNNTKEGIKAYEEVSNNVGTSIIDLTNCISKLKQVYGYPSNEVLFIGVLDIIRDDTSAPQFEYTIHDHLGAELDISNCLNNEVSIKKSLIHSDDISLAKNVSNLYGYNILDYKKENSFFCDICTSFDYDHSDPYDVLLNDRYDYYYNIHDYYFCENTCDSEKTKADFDNFRVDCACKGKNNFVTYSKQSFQKFEKSSKICKDWFMQYLKCYKIVFSKNFGENIGNIFILCFIILQICTIFAFFLFSKKSIISHIRDILLKKPKRRHIENENDNKNKKSISGSGSYKTGENKKSHSESKNTKSNNRHSGSHNKTGSESGSDNKYTYSKSGNSNESYSKSEESGRSGSKNDDDISYSNSENSKPNPPPRNENNNYNYNFYKGNNNKISINDENRKNNNVVNKNAAKPLSQRYAKRFLNNRKDYVDNSYREDSYDFDIPKDKRSMFEDGEEEEEDENKEKEENKSDKKEENKDKAPPANEADKLEKKKLKEEIRKFKKKSFGELYWFILIKRHRIISLFSNKDIYDIFSFKFSLLILSFTFDFFFTTLLYFNFEIRLLFHKKKSIDPLYDILMGIACTLASTILMRVVDLTMEFRKEFKQYEINMRNNENINYFKTFHKIMKKLNLKMIIYYLINFIFSLFVWYMVSSFIATYFNTKLSWGIMIGINIALSNIFPFLYYLIAVKIQYKAIQEERLKLYKFGMTLLKI